jgi:hypothetical protein
MHFTTFVDVKSEELRDILREVLKDINTVCLREDKPTVRETFVSGKPGIYLLLISHLGPTGSLIQLFTPAAGVPQAYTHTRLKRNPIPRPAVAVPRQLLHVYKEKSRTTCGTFRDYL